MGRERMLSGARASLEIHVSTWVHAILGGKFSSLGFPGEGGQTPHACTQVDGESLHAGNFFFSIVDLCNLGGEPTHCVMKLIVLSYEAQNNCVVPESHHTLSI
jgi:hypothetical protein